MIAMMYRISTRLSEEEFDALEKIAKASRRDVKDQAAVTIIHHLGRLGYLPLGNRVHDPDITLRNSGDIEGAKDLRIINIRLTREEYLALAIYTDEISSNIRTQARELIRQGLEFHSLLPEKAA